MTSALSSLEEYVTSLTTLGVFPTFVRNYNGWTCILKNGVNIQIMPFNGEQCWGETMLDALTFAVDGLNRRFEKPEDLHKYINTGICQDVESLLDNIESMFKVNSMTEPIKAAAEIEPKVESIKEESVMNELLH